MLFRSHAAIGVVNDKIYVIGGRVGAAFIGVASNTDVVEEYDPATDSWSPTSLIGAPSPRAGHGSVWTGSRVVIWGGYQGSTPLNSGGSYDPSVTAGRRPRSRARPHPEGRTRLSGPGAR